MPTDRYGELPGANMLTWTDKIRARLKEDHTVVDVNTGAEINPKREFLRERIRAREQEAAAAKAREK